MSEKKRGVYSQRKHLISILRHFIDHKIDADSGHKNLSESKSILFTEFLNPALMHHLVSDKKNPRNLGSASPALEFCCARGDKNAI